MPRPIAAQLAAEFWINLTDGQDNAIKSPHMPDELKRALCERLADLNYLSNAREVAARLCGANGPFGSAEVLNTETGARCLRELATVAPEEVLDTLDRCFGSWSEEMLRDQFGPGRRWTVWALDALVWDIATFEPSIRFLFRLAVSENETWGNNATNEFAHPRRFALYVARIAPLFTPESNRQAWSNIARMLLDKFGTRNDILNEMSANMHTGSWSGPTSQYLQGFLPPLKQLLNHRVAGVRRWAKREASMIEKQINAEIVEEEEWRLRHG